MLMSELNLKRNSDELRSTMQVRLGYPTKSNMAKITCTLPAGLTIWERTEFPSYNWISWACLEVCSRDMEAVQRIRKR